MSGVLLEGTSLEKSYGGVVAVNGVDLRVGQGEVVGLVGPNGAGKTTLVDLISGAQAADGGVLKLAGSALAGSAAQRGALGLARTFQYPAVAAELSVRDNLLVGLAAARHGSAWSMLTQMLLGAVRPHRTSDLRGIEAVAAEVRLGGLDRLAGDVTLGEQRLVEVGRALAQDPALLLLDEPFAGADRAGVEGINSVINIVRERGRGVLLVDHNIDLVASVVDRVVLLDRGSVAFDGAPRECMASTEMQRVYFGEQHGVEDA